MVPYRKLKGMLKKLGRYPRNVGVFKEKRELSKKSGVYPRNVEVIQERWELPKKGGSYPRKMGMCSRKVRALSDIVEWVSQKSGIVSEKSGRLSKKGGINIRERWECIRERQELYPINLGGGSQKSGIVSEKSWLVSKKGGIIIEVGTYSYPRKEGATGISRRVGGCPRKEEGLPIRKRWEGVRSIWVRECVVRGEGTCEGGREYGKDEKGYRKGGTESGKAR
jgi:hypothetical protein